MGHVRQVAGRTLAVIQTRYRALDVCITRSVNPTRSKLLRIGMEMKAAVEIDGIIGYFIKYLDQININNAFVSGM